MSKTGLILSTDVDIRLVAICVCVSGGGEGGGGIFGHAVFVRACDSVSDAKAAQD